MLKEVKEKIKRTLRRRYLINDKHHHYETDENHGYTVKKFPAVTDSELTKTVNKAMNYPRAEQRRVCRYLFGHLSSRSWGRWMDMRKELA